jgi:hypothetical protein
LVNEVEFTGDSFYDSGQFAQWRVYEIEIYEALPWPPIIISISPISQQGEQGEMLSYIVTVKNIGTEDNSYNLIVSDNMNWNLAPDDNRFDNVAPGENMVTTLRVTIPENAIPDEIDNITVTATSLTDNTVTASSSCTAQAKLRVRLDIGWNLVCFTGVAENDTLNNIFVGLDYNVDYLMYYWSAPGGPYTGMNPSQPLKDNTGYWVQMITTSKVVNTTGTQPDTENMEYALGWNLVGFPVVNGTTTPNKIFAPLIYTTDYLMYYWTAPFGPYSGVNPALALEDNTGYWILIDLNKTVTVP